MQPLTASERLDFERVVLNARVMGWLAPDQQLTAVPRYSTVLVYSLRGGRRCERTYERTHRWIFELLHDLVDGAWKDAAESQRPFDARALRPAKEVARNQPRANGSDR